MRLRYYQQIRRAPERNAAILDGSISGSGRKQSEEFLSFYRRQNPGIELEIVPAELEWEAEPLWQNL